MKRLHADDPATPNAPRASSSPANESAPVALRSPYASYDVLSKWDSPSWDDLTREVVRKRIEEVPERRFLTAGEWETLVAVCGRLIPQPDRPGAAIPIAPWIDRKLDRNQGDGYRHTEMPPLRDVWRLGLSGIESEARRRHGGAFTSLSPHAQDDVLSAIQRADVQGDPWDRLPAERFFTETLLKAVVGEYYAHPAAWNEVGFGGPASPRGYVRLGEGQRDPWEAAEQADE